jgi:hypothetical protein
MELRARRDASFAPAQRAKLAFSSRRQSGDVTPKSDDAFEGVIISMDQNRHPDYLVRADRQNQIRRVLMPGEAQ